MSISATGYEKETMDTIFLRLVAAFKDVFPDLNINPDNLVYHWMKADALEKSMLQQQIEDALENITPIGAQGVWLDKHAINRGLHRKQAAFANGYILANGIPDNSIIPVGSTFSTPNNKKYISTEDVYFLDRVSLTRLAGNEDDIPTGFKNITFSGLYLDPDYNTPISDDKYLYSGDVIYWIETGYLLSGTQYYGVISGSMNVYVPVQCDTVGTYGNTASNTIIVNTDSLSNIVSLYNEDDILNGREVETDIELRARILEANNAKSLTLTSIKSLVGDLEEVKSCNVWQTNSVDKTSNSDWTTVSGCTGIALESTGTYGFSFYPSSGICSLGGVRLYGYVSGYAPDLHVSIHYYGGGLFTSELRSTDITMEHLERDFTSVWQDINVPLLYNGLDMTKTYRIQFYQKENPNSGFWVLGVTGLTTLPTYRNDSFTGSVSMGGTGFIYATKYNVPAVNVEVIPYTNYIFETDVKPVIQALFDEGNFPICVQSNIYNANAIYLGVRARIDLLPGYILSEVVFNIKQNITNYLNSLSVGEDVVYSQISYAILQTNGVKRLRNLQICVNNGTWITNATERDLSIGDHEYIILDTAGIYQGVSIS